MNGWSNFSADGDKDWLINKEETVIIKISGVQIRQSKGWNLSRIVSFDDIYMLHNIYVKPSARGNGLFRETLDEVYMYLAARNKALVLFPTPFEFKKCPFEYGYDANIYEILDKEQREKLIEFYKSFGLNPCKTGYAGKKMMVTLPNGETITHTDISGEETRRKANNGEYFFVMVAPYNFGYQYLGASFGASYPQSLFYLQEYDPQFKEKIAGNPPNG